MGRPRIGRLAALPPSPPLARVKCRVVPQALQVPKPAADREMLQELLDESGGGLELEAALALKLAGPCVYVWLDGADQPLYVGMSRNGVSRPLSGRHHRFALVAEHAARVVLYPMRSVGAAGRAEAILLRQLRPRFNVQGVLGGVADRLGVTVPRVATWARAYRTEQGPGVIASPEARAEGQGAGPTQPEADSGPYTA